MANTNAPGFGNAADYMDAYTPRPKKSSSAPDPALGSVTSESARQKYNNELHWKDKAAKESKMLLNSPQDSLYYQRMSNKEAIIQTDEDKEIIRKIRSDAAKVLGDLSVEINYKMPIVLINRIKKAK